MTDRHVWMTATGDVAEDVAATLGPGPLVTFTTLGPDRYGAAEECVVTSEQAARWRAAERAYRAALDEMRAIHAAAQALSAAMEDAVDEAEGVLIEEAQRDAAVLRLMTEAEADREYGPREWVFFERTRTVYSRMRAATVVVGITIHHRDCRFVPPDYLDHLMHSALRLPDAVAEYHKAEAAHYRYRTPVPHVCKRCGERVRALTHPTTTPED